MMHTMLSMIFAAPVDPWISNSFPIIRIILIALMVADAIAVIVCVLLQQGNSEGLGAISGGSETFFGKNKGKTLEGRLKKITMWCSIGLAIISILFFITVAIYPVGA